MKSVKNNTGLALIMALWILTVLVVMVAEIASLVRLDSQIIINLKHQTQAYYLAASGINKAIGLLMTDKTEEDTLEDNWAKLIEEDNCRIEIVDEQGKLNLNQINQPILAALFKQCLIEPTEETINNILDYKDVDDLSRTWTTEKGAKNLLFDSLEELSVIMPKTSLLKLKDHLSTVGQINLNLADLDTLTALLYGQGGSKMECGKLSKQIIELRQQGNKFVTFTHQEMAKKLTESIGEKNYQLIKDSLTTEPVINVNTASKEALAAFFEGLLGAESAYLADKILQERAGKPFKTSLELCQRVTELAELQIKEYLGVQSRYFTVIASSCVQNSTITRRITAAVERYRDKESKQRIKILSWCVQ